MAFGSSPVQQVTKSEASGSTIVFTTSALTAGNLIVICITQSAGSTAVYPSSVSLNSGSGTFVVMSANTVQDGPPPQDWQSGANSYASIIYCLSLTTGGATSVTVNMSGTKTCGGVLTEWNPSGDTVSVDSSKHGGGGTASGNQPDVAVTSTGAGLIISSHRAASATVTAATGQQSPGSGWTSATTQPATTAGVAWQVFSSAQTGAHPGWTTTSSKWGTVTVAFLTTASGHNVSVGIASETDAAQALTANKAKALTNAAETDTAVALTGLKRLALGIASVTNSALSITALKSLALGISSETDAAQAITRSGNYIPVTTASETDTALTIPSLKSAIVTTSTETDTALAFSITKSQTLGIATETDTAVALSSTSIPSINYTGWFRIFRKRFGGK